MSVIKNGEKMTDDKKNDGGLNFQHVDYQKETDTLKVRLDFYHLVMQGLDRMDIPVPIVNKNYKILYTNQRCQELLGMKKKQAIGRYCYDLYQTRNCKTAMYLCRMAMTWDAFAECENLTSENQIIPSYAAPIKDAKGTMIPGTGILEIRRAN